MEADDYVYGVQHYDFILAGGGAAGLSLAYQMVNDGLDGSILIIDMETKTRNDRTWCFWIDEPMPYDEIISHRWEHIWFHGPERSHRFPLAPYRYNMIRGIDFYNFTRERLDAAPNVTFCTARVDSVEDGSADGTTLPRVTIDSGEVFTASWVFNSLFIPREFVVDENRYFFLKQHFAGWVIRTEEPVFDPEAATMFDLRIPQNGAFRFMYLLPTSSNESLVEYTLFSEQLLPKEEYVQGIRDYIQDQLGDVAYTIVEEEAGIIPMTDQPFLVHEGQRVMNIGTRGGRVKASTGFAFLRTVRDSQRIVASLKAIGTPFHDHYPPRRYRTFDSMLLSVLSAHPDDGRDIFIRLFERNPLIRLWRFLDEEGSLWENIKLMNTVPWWPFIFAWFRVKWKQTGIPFNRSSHTDG